jgi:hypothetical protein
MMKRKLWSPGIWFLGLFTLVLLIGVPKPSFAVHEDTDADGVMNCDAGQVNGDCTISTEHTIGANVTIEGNLTITSTGHIKFTGSDPRQLYVKGDLDIQVSGDDKGKISYEGTGTANPGQNGGTLIIIVDGNANVSGEVSVRGGNGSQGATGGNGGVLTFNVCGDFTSTGNITAKGGNGGGGTTPGNGGSGGVIEINVNGNVVITAGEVNAKGGSGPGAADDGADGTITINTAQVAVNTAGATFNPVPTINLNQVDPAQCSQPVPEGCSLGYWKNHTGSWPVVYSPAQTVGSVFNQATAPLADATLLQALSFKGGSTLDGAKQILLRQAVAALLNAAHSDVSYPRTVAEVIAAVNAQLGSETRSAILALAGELDVDNNLGCPLN